MNTGHPSESVLILASALAERFTPRRPDKAKA